LYAQTLENSVRQFAITFLGLIGLNPQLLQILNQTDTLIVTELSRLGRSTAEVIALVNALIQRNIRLITIK
jgi:Resolvase, N terminal domain